MQDDIRHELIIPNDDISFKMFMFEGKDGNYFRDKHWHRSVEIFAVLDGELDFFLEDDRIHLTPGQFVLVNSNEIHSIHAIRPNMTVVMQIPVSTFHRYYFNNSFIYFTHSRRDADEQVMQLIKEMYSIYDEKQLGYELAVQSRFYQLLYILVIKYREDDTDHEPASLRSRSKMTEITDYIKENYNKKITLELLGSVFGYSSTYVSKMFRKYTGYTFKDYLENIRIAYAVQDMEQSRETLEIIAAKHGFPDRKALNKAFKAKYNKTPSEYMRNI